MPITKQMWQDPQMRPILLAAARRATAARLAKPQKKQVYFLSRMNIDEQTGCWNWTGYTNEHGYGMMPYAGHSEFVHRVSAHVFLRFDLRSQLFVLHRCDNPKCFNPKHLFAGNQTDNMRDASSKGRILNQKKTHCPQGHPYSAENTRIKPCEGRRRCRACTNVYRRAFRRKEHARKAWQETA